MVVGGWGRKEQIWSCGLAHNGVGSGFDLISDDVCFEEGDSKVAVRALGDRCVRVLSKANAGCWHPTHTWLYFFASTWGNSRLVDTGVGLRGLDDLACSSFNMNKQSKGKSTSLLPAGDPRHPNGRVPVENRLPSPSTSASWGVFVGRF